MKEHHKKTYFPQRPRLGNGEKEEGISKMSCDDIAVGLAYAWMLMLIRYDVKEIRCHTKLVFTRELAYRQ